MTKPTSHFKKTFVLLLFCWAYFRDRLFSEEFITGRKFAFQNGLDLTTTLKQLKTANLNCPWPYIWEGLLWEGYLRLRFGTLIFGWVDFRRVSKFYGIFGLLAYCLAFRTRLLVFT